MSFEGSKADVARQIVYRDVLPRERAPYILARTAFALYREGGWLGDESASIALDLFSSDDELQFIDPPLPIDLRETIKNYNEYRKEHSIKHLDDVSILLLASAIDHGSRIEQPVDAIGSSDG